MVIFKNNGVLARARALFQYVLLIFLIVNVDLVK